MFRMIRRAVRAILGRQKIETDLDDELQFHLDMQAQEYERRGMTAQEARSATLRTFGGVQQIKEEVRDLRGVGLVEIFRQDLRFGLRALKNNPGFTFIAILALGLGIGANTAIFSVINGVLLRPLPYERGDRIVLIRPQRPLASMTDVPFSVKEVEDYRSRNHTLSGVVEYHAMWFILLGHEEPERVQTGVVSHNFFDVLGIKPLLGRSFKPEDEQHDADAVLILSYPYWQRAFGGNPNVVGQVFQMNDRPHTVIGVLPQIPQYPNENDVYMPTSACPFRSNENFIADRGALMMQVFGRMKDGVSLPEVQQDMDAIASTLQQEYPKFYPASVGYRALVDPLEGALTSTIKPLLSMLICTAGFVLLIVCASIANLTIARLLRREREMTIRAAMGASRVRIVRQLITESITLSVIGGLAGLIFAAASMNMLTSFAARYTPRAAEISMDARVLAFTFAVSLLTGVVFGLLPALQSRSNLARSLRDAGGRGTASHSKQRIRSVLIVAQIAVSFVLLIGAGLMMRSLFNLEAINPGFNLHNVLTMRIALNFSKYDNAEKRRNIAQRILSNFEKIPGVTSAAAGGTFPLNEEAPFMQQLVIEGRALPEAGLAQVPIVDLHVASPGYFETLGMPLLEGRTFENSDRVGAPAVVVLNESLSRHYFSNESPTGQRLSLDGGKTWSTIIGVVADVRQQLKAEVPDTIYVPLFQRSLLTLQVLLRTTRDPQLLAPAVREALYEADPEQPVDNFRTLDDVRAELLASPRLTATLLAVFAFLALVITAAGIAGVIAFSVSQRSHEIGIRMALGARQGAVLWMILRQGTVLIGAGLAAGIMAGLLFSRIMQGLLFEVQPNDLVTFIGVSLVLAIIAAAACLLPARRATMVDPTTALRSEP